MCYEPTSCACAAVCGPISGIIRAVTLLSGDNRSEYGEKQRHKHMTWVHNTIDLLLTPVVLRFVFQHNYVNRWGEASGWALFSWKFGYPNFPEMVNASVTTKCSAVDLFST